MRCFAAFFWLSSMNFLPLVSGITSEKEVTEMGLFGAFKRMPIIAK